MPHIQLRYTFTPWIGKGSLCTKGEKNQLLTIEYKPGIESINTKGIKVLVQMKVQVHLPHDSTLLAMRL